MREIGAVTLQHLLETGSTLAVLDVREHGEYNSAHIPGASSLPRRLIEHRIDRLVPGRQEQIVVCDDTGIRARLAISDSRRRPVKVLCESATIHPLRSAITTRWPYNSDACSRMP